VSRTAIITLLPLLLGCTDNTLDDLFWENEGAGSIEDYHDLPLYQGSAPPTWLDEDAIDRRVYLEVGTAFRLSESLPPSNGDFIHGVWMPAPAGCPVADCPLIDSDVTFVYQHGNSGDLFRYWYRAVSLWMTGANVFIYTYRGFGISSGEVTRSNVLEDAATAMTWVLQQPEVDPARVFPYGYSTGAIPSSWIAGESEWSGSIAGLITESGLDSIESVLYLGTATEFPSSYFLDSTPFDGPTFLEAGLDAPVLLLWGSQDTRVYREQVERYLQVLSGHDDVTTYLGEGDDPVDDWMAEAGHRNVVHWPFAAPLHIADYWSVDNLAHCCINPLEFGEAQYEDFLVETGKTTGEDMAAASLEYRALVSDWVLDRLD
jgi:dienelactone hydrolase